MELATINNKTVDITPNHIVITHQKVWAILERRSNADGLQGITFSTEITNKDVAIINNSGIAQVILVNTSGTISFQRKNFFDTQQMIELIIDILQKHQS